jgi:hypothetical protein
MYQLTIIISTKHNRTMLSYLYYTRIVTYNYSHSPTQNGPKKKKIDLLQMIMIKNVSQ